MKDPKNSLGGYVALGERLTAQKCPITAEQLQEFKRFPDGFASDLTVEMKRLPNSYWPDGQQFTDWAYLTVSPKGEPCIVAVIDDMYTVVCGTEVYPICPQHPEDREAACCIRFLGFWSDGLPVVCVNPRDENHATKVLGGIYCGSERLYPSTQTLRGATLLADDLILYWTRENNKHVLYKNLYKIDETEINASTPVRFFRKPTGTIFCLRTSEETRRKSPYSFTFGTFNTPDLFHTQTFVDVVEVRDEHSHFSEFQGITEQSIVKAFVPGMNGLIDVVLQDYSIGENLFRMHFKRLPNDRIAYVGKPTRDNLFCMVVDGKEQAGFGLVSPLFERDGTWMYYGLRGRQLFTMEIPKKG